MRKSPADCRQDISLHRQFLPIYDEVYSVIENQSLPHFLGYAKTNINRPKQLFWSVPASRASVPKLTPSGTGLALPTL